MNVKNKFDTILTVLLIITCTIIVLIPLLNYEGFRIIISFILFFFLPGYSLIYALYPKKHDLDFIQRILLSLSLSIVITLFISISLYYTPFRAGSLTPIILSLSVFTIFMSTIAYIKKIELDEDERFNVDFKYYFNKTFESFKRETVADRFLSIVLVISIIIVVPATAYVMIPKEGEKFTEFYILGPNGTANDYPTNLTSGETGNVTVGIVNHEQSTVNYEMVVKLNNQIIADKNITLSNGETYLEPFTFTPYSYGSNHELEFLLYKLPYKNNVYRSLRLMVDIQ